MSGDLSPPWERSRSRVLGGADAAGLSQSTGHWVVLSLLWAVGPVVVLAPPAAARDRRC